MIQAIKKILNNKKHRNITVLCILCVSLIGLSVWFFTDGSSDTNIDETQVPLSNAPTKITEGDIVIVNVFADALNDVYGYQFEINYNRELLEYRKYLYSDIDDIITIFATDKEQFLLIGATMIGAEKGYSGQHVPVCRVEFVALSDFDPRHITLSGVNVLTDKLQYLENVTGWSADITVQ